MHAKSFLFFFSMQKNHRPENCRQWYEDVECLYLKYTVNTYVCQLSQQDSTSMEDEKETHQNEVDRTVRTIDTRETVLDTALL